MDDTKDEEIDVFEIDDFTAASEWERFIYRIEEILGPHGWRLNNNEKKKEDTKKPTDYNKPQERVPSTEQNREKINWVIQSECLKFATFNFNLSHHKLTQPEGTSITGGQTCEGLPPALIDSFDVAYDFPPRAHCLSRWYGVKEFLVLSPVIKDESIDTESRTNLLWSSVGIALSNLKCQLPIFIQIGHWKRRLHYGMCVGGGFRSSYEMIHLQYTPHECNHVQGMIETFKEKLARPLIAPVHISIRFTYIIKNWSSELLCPQPFLPESDDVEETVISYGDLPLGPLSEPISDLQLAVSWPSISSDMLNDDENFSDLNPDHAPQWWLKARCTEMPDVLLSEHLKCLLKLCKQPSDSTANIIRSLSSTESLDNIDGLSDDVTNVLNRLVDPVQSFSVPIQNTIMNSARKVMKTQLTESPIPEALLVATLEYLFPDSNKTKEESIEIQKSLSDEQKTIECDAIRNRDHYRNLKSAPNDSLTYNLALCIFIMNYEYGGIEGVAHLWHEFVLEMRYRLENNILIPKLALTVPNLNYCLLHQKLQMLNYCIERRQHREASHQTTGMESKDPSDIAAAVSYKDYTDDTEGEESVFHSTDDASLTTSTSSLNKDKTWSDLLATIEKVDSDSKKDFVSFTSATSTSNEDSDEEFYEAQEEMSSSSITPPPVKMEEEPVEPEEPKEPEGVLEETEMKLMKVDKQLCIPITQQPPPLTEDVLMEQQDVMTRLGTSEEAAKVRAQMQSASLISDMEAFKAANPGSILEDFVRWYSPNDWIPGPETEDEKAELAKYVSEHNVEKKKAEGWEFELEDELDDSLLDEMTGEGAEVEGHLSLRMRVPGNAWKEMWGSARAIPVRRQKRLFDDTKEAEKVLHFLSNLRPCEIALQIFPIIIHSCLMRISREEDAQKVQNILENVINRSARLQSPSKNDLKLMDGLVKDILRAETIISRIQSFRHKFYPDPKQQDDEMESFIQDLMNSSEVNVKAGSKSRIGKVIKSFLLVDDIATPSNQQEGLHIPIKKKFPPASGREYILRTTLPLPSDSSRPSPQRMFTVITPDEFRMAGSFTHDTNFI